MILGPGRPCRTLHSKTNHGSLSNVKKKFISAIKHIRLDDASGGMFDN
jgi:hypothetical protein